METTLITKRLNHISHLNDYLDDLNKSMERGDRIECHAVSSFQQREYLMRKLPPVINKIAVILQYFWHNLCPKMKFTRNIYFPIAGEKNRMYSRTEILGRLCRAGFRILEERNTNIALYITAEKRSDPLGRNKSCVRPIMYLDRVGKGGKMIKVYKVRTMHSYAQYLQEYVYEKYNLRKGGKLANDFRISIWGRLLRPLWLDELPMVWNVIRGDIKLVGVRPLSQHYFSLYTPEMQALRITVKPGLIPPFYYEKKSPETMEEIQDSERRYIEAYKQHPFKTDWKYFWGTVSNIVIKRKRSH